MGFRSLFLRCSVANSKSKRSGENFEHYTSNSHKDIFEVIKNKRSKLLHSVVDFQQLLNLGSSCAMFSVLGHRKWPWLRIIALHNHVYSERRHAGKKL